MIEKCCLVRFSKKSGKIDTTMEGLGNAMMRLWALQNTPQSKECLIFSLETGQIFYRVVGTRDFPRMDDFSKVGFHHINDYCEGLLGVLA